MNDIGERELLMKRIIPSMLAAFLIISMMTTAVMPAFAAEPATMRRITVRIPVDHSMPAAPDFYMMLTNVYTKYHWGNFNEQHPNIRDSTVFDMNRNGTVSFSHDTVLEWRIDGHIWNGMKVNAGEIIRLADEQFAYRRDIVFVITTGFMQTGNNEMIPSRTFLRFYDASNNQTSGVSIRGTGDTVTLAAGYTPPVTANPTKTTIYINGVATQFEAYMINDRNYFKVRDLGYVFDRTEKQFELTYDYSTGQIYMTSGRPYSRFGGEMAQGDGRPKTAVFNAGIAVDKDGVPVHIRAYMINDMNFVMMRDILELFNIGSTFNPATGEAMIDTSKPFTG